MKSNKLFLVILALFLVLSGSALAQDEKPACWGTIPEYKPFKKPDNYYTDKILMLYDFNGEESGLVEYLHKKKKEADISLVAECCKKYNPGNCSSAFISDFDGNTLPLTAAEIGNLPVLKYFVTTKYEDGKVIRRGFNTDWIWRKNRKTQQCDIAGRSELMHAIANDDLPMVKFLLGVGEEANIDENGNKIVYSNPKRTAPHPDPECRFEFDARDYARWHKGEIDPRIITTVEEAWETAGPEKRETSCNGKFDSVAALSIPNITPWIFDMPGIQQRVDYAINSRKLDNYFKNGGSLNIFDRYLTTLLENIKGKSKEEKNIKRAKAKEKPDAQLEPQPI